LTYLCLVRSRATRSAFLLMPLPSESRRIFSLLNFLKPPRGLLAAARLYFPLSYVLFVMYFLELAIKLLTDFAEHSAPPSLNYFVTGI
jgi:hypothetical protein